MMIADRCLFPIGLILKVFWTHLARLRSPTSTALAQLGGDLLGGGLLGDDGLLGGGLLSGSLLLHNDVVVDAARLREGET